MAEVVVVTRIENGRLWKPLYTARIERQSGAASWETAKPYGRIELRNDLVEQGIPTAEASAAIKAADRVWRLDHRERDRHRFVWGERLGLIATVLLFGVSGLLSAVPARPTGSISSYRLS